MASIIVMGTEMHETDTREPRRILRLDPPGPDVSSAAAGPLARIGGELAGAVVEGAVRTWLADANGQLILIMWPRGFCARFDPLELLDDRGQPLARGGDIVTVGGAFLRPGDARSLGHELAFAAWRVSRNAAHGQ